MESKIENPANWATELIPEGGTKNPLVSEHPNITSAVGNTRAGQTDGSIPQKATTVAKTEDFDVVMQKELTYICEKLLASVTQRIDNLQSNQEKSLAMDSIYGEITSAMEKLMESKDVKSFDLVSELLINSLDDTIHTPQHELMHDALFGKSFGLTLLLWVRPFEKLLVELREMGSKAHLATFQDLKDKEMEKYETIIKQLRADLVTQSQEAEITMAQFQAERFAQMRAYQDAVDRERAERNKFQADSIAKHELEGKFAKMQAEKDAQKKAYQDVIVRERVKQKQLQVDRDAQIKAYQDVLEIEHANGNAQCERLNNIVRLNQEMASALKTRRQNCSFL